jgi:hypothetical protein
MSVVTQLDIHNVEENNYTFRPLSGWAIIRLRLEYRRKLIYYNVDIKNGETGSRFTMCGEVRSYIHATWNRRSSILPNQRLAAILTYASSHLWQCVY